MPAKRGGSSGYTRGREGGGTGSGTSGGSTGRRTGSGGSHEETIKAAREQLDNAKVTRNYQPVTIDAGSNGTASITRSYDPDVGTEYIVRSSNESYYSSFATLSDAKRDVTRRLKLDQPLNDEERRRARNNMMWWTMYGGR